MTSGVLKPRTLAKKGKLLKSQSSKLERHLIRSALSNRRAIIIPFRDILLTPYHATVARFTRLLQPSYRLMTAYINSFIDGTQERFMKMAWKSAINGEGIDVGFKLADKVKEGWKRRWAEAERRLEEREKEKSRLQEEAERKGRGI